MSDKCYCGCEATALLPLPELLHANCQAAFEAGLKAAAKVCERERFSGNHVFFAALIRAFKPAIGAEACEKCDGRGDIWEYYAMCPTCNGTGKKGGGDGRV